ncbi:FMN-dependent oxidoreductase, nitrilotriacetate monooxygenase family [Terribacillus halophilus]|uniref:FMN-dependent oxidoreductase, nitrilotriacetate monooxygenase family n=1 Tax=Terribacillus halophilus TaxID=361279 RepID=A0A1G6TAS1_9BACI|nr:LLM class flavin-dependent oxidoreductase [Terribacillus halophilus]SDD26119.1 FMN-dependent oxidoreductase, nitrilotriacetate monooxygenase family [Terribacillus halophilus]
MEKKQLHLGLFLMGSGHHIASWRHPDVEPEQVTSFRYFAEIAKKAEEGKLDMLFLSDGLSFHELSHPAELSRFEPISLLSALAAVTNKIGLASTVTTTYNEPFHVARKFLSLDHLSGGRAGWNVVTSYYESEAKNFSKKEHLAHQDRYIRAQEFLEVVDGLWGSWEPDALVRDKESGVYFEKDKLHQLNHDGAFFSVEGPLNIERSPQGKPVIIQAGSSNAGVNLAARSADIIFTAQDNLADARAFYRSVKDKVQAYGRNPEHVKIMPGVSVYVGKTYEEAVQKYEQLQQLITPEVGQNLLSEYLGGFAISPYDVDGPLPENIPETNGNKSRRALLIKLAEEKQLTIRELYQYVAGSRGHRLLFGTAEQIADDLENWLMEGGADGFNLMLPTFPSSLDEFVDQVVPVLQQRGIYREDYSGSTLRAHLGLLEPVYKRPILNNP